MKRTVYPFVAAAVSALLALSLPLRAQVTGKDASGHRLSEAAAKLLFGNQAGQQVDLQVDSHRGWQSEICDFEPQGLRGQEMRRLVGVG